MSQATFTFGRFNPPTESGHGKLISAVQAHAEKAGGKHYIFPSHSQDAKKNPLSHGDKVGAMQKLFPNANVVSHNKVRTAIDAMKHLEKQGHSNVTMVVGSDRVAEFHGLLSKYRKKEFPGIKKVNVVSAGNRDPDAEGAEGMSASKLRGLVAAGKKKEFVSHYSDPKLGAHIHDKIKAGMQMESVSPVGIFLLGGPGSGKDYVLKNIFSHFDLTEVQADQILNGVATELVEQNKHIVINGVSDESKITIIQNMLEGYNFDYVHVSVTNKVSRLRNEQREQPLVESKRIDKFLKAEQLAQSTEAFIFNNSINLNESSELEKVFFADQIEKLLERVTNLGLEMKTKAEPKAFSVIKEKYFPPVVKDKASGLPKKYVRGLSPSTAKARASHWKEKSKLSDSDPRAYEPAPGDATAKTKPSKHTVAVRKMMDEAELPKKLRRAAKSGNITAVNAKRELNNAERAAFEKAKIQLATSKVQEETIEEGDNSIAAKAKKTGISVGTLRKVYNRGVAAWNSGHRPGTTPQQWGHARVNSYINKGKTYHTADKDLREDADINELFEMQLVGTDEYRKHAIAMTPGQGEPVDAFPVKSPNKKPVAVVAKPGKSIVSQYEEHTNCGTPDCCGECEQTGGGDLPTVRKFSELRKEAKEKDGKDDGVETEPTLTAKHKKGALKRPNHYDYTLQGLPVTARFNAYEETEQNLPTLEEAIQYHVENKISFTENVFRPGSEMFFEMISEAKKLYKEGKYTPTDEYEVDMLNSDIGEIAEYEGQAVVLDYPIEEGLEECWTGYTQRGMKKKGDKMVPNCVPVNEADDPTGGKGIGKPFRSNGGGAVYVRVGDGVRKINFSQSGMTKKFNDPAATRSFVARHHCLSNKDKTSRSYWACRWPRFFSNSGKTWW
jgi:dephospho-CoA kinase